MRDPFTSSLERRRRRGRNRRNSTHLTHPAAALGNFGIGVSLYGDTALVGSHLDSTKGTRSGAVYVFTRSFDLDGFTVSWTEQTKIYASAPIADDQFGNKVSLYGDTALVSSVDKVYVFTRSTSSSATLWTEEATLYASTSGETDFSSVSLYRGTALIAAMYNGEKGTDSRSRLGIQSSNAPASTPRTLSTASIFSTTQSVCGRWRLAIFGIRSIG